MMTWLDDAIIHFHCSDIMASTHPHFGFLKFHAYAKHISLHVHSIGIVMQPFPTAAADAGNSSMQAQRQMQTCAHDASVKIQQCCWAVVGALIAYLQEKFPKAVMHIHNHPNKTITLTYACMIMANQTNIGHLFQFWFISGHCHL